MSTESWRDQPKRLEGNGAILLRIAEVAVAHSEGRLRIAISEEDDDEAFQPAAARFLKLNGKRLGRDIELYDFMGRAIAGWPIVVSDFLCEVILPLKAVLPVSFLHAGDELKRLGRSVLPPELHAEWDGLF